MDRLHLALTSPPKFVFLGYSSSISTATRTNQLCGNRRLARSRIRAPPRICASALNRQPHHRIIGNCRVEFVFEKWCLNLPCNFTNLVVYSCLVALCCEKTVAERFASVSSSTTSNESSSVGVPSVSVPPPSSYV